MAVQYIHSRISLVDSDGNVNVLYPNTTARDVNVSSVAYIPTEINNVQEAILDIYKEIYNLKENH